MIDCPLKEGDGKLEENIWESCSQGFSYSITSGGVSHPIIKFFLSNATGVNMFLMFICERSERFFRAKPDVFVLNNPHFLHALLDLFQRNVEHARDVQWSYHLHAARLAFHTNEVGDLLLQIPKT